MIKFVIEVNKKSGKVNSKYRKNKYTLATDLDFSGNVDGQFRYIGADEYVEIPHVIKDVPVTSYYNMFFNTSVKGVKSTNKNVTDMSWMFDRSKASSLDLSRFDTSNVRNMYRMFYGSEATTLDLSRFNTSNVTNMQEMFQDSEATNILGLNSFDTSNVWNMIGMFKGSRAASLDLSNFDISNVTNMHGMFRKAHATLGYARTQEDADKFNARISYKPETLTFVVK